jgi:death-on-curing protein
MHYPTVSDALETYRRIIEQTGGLMGIRDIGALESALAQPLMTFDEKDLYPTIVEKASALGFSLIQNHPFADGNKRTGHALMEAFLVINGFEIQATTDEQADIILKVASGEMGRADFTEWLQIHMGERKQPSKTAP